MGDLIDSSSQDRISAGQPFVAYGGYTFPGCSRACSRTTAPAFEGTGAECDSIPLSHLVVNDNQALRYPDIYLPYQTSSLITCTLTDGNTAQCTGQDVYGNSIIQTYTCTEGIDAHFQSWNQINFVFRFYGYQPNGVDPKMVTCGGFDYAANTFFDGYNVFVNGSINMNASNANAPFFTPDFCTIQSYIEAQQPLQVGQQFLQTIVTSNSVLLSFLLIALIVVLI